VVPFGGMRKPVSTAGLSDHFPIAMTVREADRITPHPADLAPVHGMN
jgi:hypothetical protein